MAFFAPAIAIFIILLLAGIQNQKIVTEMLARTPEITNPSLIGLIHLPLSEHLSKVWTMVNATGLLATGLYAAYQFAFIYFSCLHFDKIKIDLTPQPKTDRNFLFCILWLQFLSVLPIFCSAWDWGRWIFLWTASSFAYFLIADENPFGEKIVSKVNVILTSKWLQKVGNNQIFVFFITTLIGVQYQIPLEIEFFTRTPIYSILRVISEAVLYLKEAII